MFMSSCPNVLMSLCTHALMYLCTHRLIAMRPSLIGSWMGTAARSISRSISWGGSGAGGAHGAGGGERQECHHRCPRRTHSDLPASPFQEAQGQTHSQVGVPWGARVPHPLHPCVAYSPQSLHPPHCPHCLHSLHSPCSDSGRGLPRRLAGAPVRGSRKHFRYSYPYPAEGA
jgi:hypothetical protein